MSRIDRDGAERALNRPDVRIALVGTNGEREVTVPRHSRRELELAEQLERAEAERAELRAQVQQLEELLLQLLAAGVDEDTEATAALRMLQGARERGRRVRSEVARKLGV
jgi:hypothetical protein